MATTPHTDPGRGPVTLSQAERDRLVEAHLDYARSLTAKLKREISADLPADELNAYAARGLVEAASRFDPSRGVAFTTFAYYRIRGAVFDGLRETGWLSRNEYARYQEASHHLLENHAERQVPGAQSQDADDERTLAGLADTLDQLATIFVTSLDACQRGDPADDETPDAAQMLEARQTQRVLHTAIETLPERERRLVELYYFQGHTLEAAGATMGLSKSWSSRLHARAVKLLTEAMDQRL